MKQQRNLSSGLSGFIFFPERQFCHSLDTSFHQFRIQGPLLLPPPYLFLNLDTMLSVNPSDSSSLHSSETALLVKITSLTG